MSDGSVSFSVLCDCANIRKCCFKVHGDVCDFFFYLISPCMLRHAKLSGTLLCGFLGTGAVTGWLSANSYVKLMNGAHHECHLLPEPALFTQNQSGA